MKESKLEFYVIPISLLLCSAIFLIGPYQIKPAVSFLCFSILILLIFNLTFYTKDISLYISVLVLFVGLFNFIMLPLLGDNREVYLIPIALLNTLALFNAYAKLDWINYAFFRNIKTKIFILSGILFFYLSVLIVNSNDSKELLGIMLVYSITTTFILFGFYVPK